MRGHVVTRDMNTRRHHRIDGFNERPGCLGLQKLPRAYLINYPPGACTYALERWEAPKLSIAKLGIRSPFQHEIPSPSSLLSKQYLLFGALYALLVSLVSRV